MRQRNTLGVYKTPLIEVSTKCVFTNTTPVGAYRGAGRPEANYYMERLVDAAVARDGHRPGRTPPPQPHPGRGDAVQGPNGTTYDSGEFTDLLEQGGGARRLGRVSAARKAESRARGKLRGRGISDYLELTGAARPRDGRHPLRAERRRDDRHRYAGLRPGALPRRSRRCLATRLGIPFGRIRLLQGDSDELIAGGGTGGSKSMIVSGNAIVGAADKVIERGKQIAAHVLEAAAADIEFRARPFRHRRHRPLGRPDGAGRANSTPG